MEKERVYICNQLACMLPPTALKTLFYLISWQSQEQIKYYSKQFEKTMHLDQAEIEQAIQLLVDKELISVNKIDGNWVFELQKNKIQSYFNVPMARVAEHQGFKLPQEITWNKGDKKEEQKPASYEDLSESQIDKLIQRLQIIKNEKAEVQKKVVAVAATQNDVIDDDYGLPF